MRGTGKLYSREFQNQNSVPTHLVEEKQNISSCYGLFLALSTVTELPISFKVTKVPVFVLLITQDSPIEVGSTGNPNRFLSYAFLHMSLSSPVNGRCLRIVNRVSKQKFVLLRK